MGKDIGIKDSYKTGWGAAEDELSGNHACLSLWLSLLGQRPTLWRWRIRVTRQAITGVE